jgi:7-keto-8-aminopelargonate synthetase-like enzyme
MRELLWNRARTFVFSTAPSPWLTEITRFHVQQTRRAEHQRSWLDSLARSLREALKRHGLSPLAGSFGPIVPVLVGEERRAMKAVERLADVGIIAQAIRQPTVPAGTARIRLTVKANWSEHTPELVASALSASVLQ